MSTPSALVLAVALLAANGFFVAAEFALLAARRSRIEQLAAQGDRRAHHAAAGIRELSLMLAGAQLGITICSLGLGAVAEPAIARLIEAALDGIVELPDTARHTIGFGLALSIVVFLHMVVGEMAPKSWAITHPESAALALARPFRGFALLLRPAIRLLNMLANAVVRLSGVQPQDELALAHSPADLRLLLEESVRHGTIAADEHRLLARSLALSGLDATAAMTPRHDVVAVAVDDTAADVAAVAHRSGRTRLVVHDGDLDHVLGVIHTKDVLLLDPGRRATSTARDLMRPALVTHEGRLIEDLLLEMRARRQHLAVIIDERGVVSGIVTLQDVLEELIGDWEDHFGRHTQRIQPLADGTYLLAGDARPDELATHTGIELPDGDWETVVGYMVAALDRIPSPGDIVHAPTATIEVTSVIGHAIETVRVVPSTPSP
jgi:CBS domain containing-hemolysin-like protein